MTHLEIFSQNMHRFRKTRGLTQYELAAKTELSQSTINQLETGRKRPSMESADKISKALKVPLFWLFKPKPVSKI